MKKKKGIAEPNFDAAGTGSAADVEEIMRKYDRESNTRYWEERPSGS